MKGRQLNETTEEAPGSEVRAAYRGLEAGRLVAESLGRVIGKIEVLEGDGSVATIIKITFPPGSTPGQPGYLKEKFRAMDDGKRVKETELVEGGFLDLLALVSVAFAWRSLRKVDK